MGKSIDEKIDCISLREIESFYNENYEELFLNAIKFSKNKEEAEDIIGDVFLGLIKSPPQIDRENLKKYIFVSTRNSFINKKRLSHERITISENNFDKVSLIRLANGTPEEEMDFYEDRRYVLREAMEKMSPNRREVFKYRVYENLSNEEIAKITGKTYTTVAVTYNRALKTLRSHLLTRGIRWEGKSWIVKSKKNRKKQEEKTEP